MAVVSAPGKLILMGEHGVVYGLPALTAALGLRARAELEAAGGEHVELELPDLGVVERTGWRRIRDAAERARERWRAYAEGAPFERPEDPAAGVRLALGEAAGELDPASLPGLRVRVRSELPVGAGFGSSAAVAVAVIAGFLAWRGVEPDPERVEPVALEVERRQHGSPSGVDHGTVLRGGVQWAERDAAGALRLRPVDASRERLRSFRVYDSGPPAESTGTVVAAVAERRRAGESSFDQALGRMREATTEFRVWLEGAAGGDPAAAVTSFQRCLERLGVVPEPVRREVRRLEAAGGAAKISGAGALTGRAAGCLLVIPPPPGSPWSAPAAWRRLDCAMGAPGLRVEAA